ncbi:hypothetical protein OAB43_00650 [Bacteroidia bacterium]|nr:hypothetical protein [Bacteroidia bacterium]
MNKFLYLTNKNFKATEQITVTNLTLPELKKEEERYSKQQSIIIDSTLHNDISEIIELAVNFRLSETGFNTKPIYVLFLDEKKIIEAQCAKLQLINFWQLPGFEAITESRLSDVKWLDGGRSIQSIDQKAVISSFKFNLGSNDHHGISNKWAAINLARSLGIDYASSDEPLLEAYKLATSSKLDFDSKVLKKLQNDPELKTIDSVSSAKDLKSLLSLNDEEPITLLDDLGDLWKAPLEKLFGVKKVEVETTLDNLYKFKDAKLILWDLRFSEYTASDSLDNLKDFKSSNPHIPIIVFTASNKSWNRDAAFQAGADGYWLKEGIDDDNDTVFSTWVNNLKTLFLVKSKYEVLRPYWEAVKQIEQNFLPEFRDRDRIEGTKFVKRFEERLKMFYGLLKRGKEQNSYNKANFFYDDYELAFITLWSLLIDLSEAFFIKENIESLASVKNSDWESTQDYSLKFKKIECEEWYLNKPRSELDKYLFKTGISVSEVISSKGYRIGMNSDNLRRTKYSKFKTYYSNKLKKQEAPFFTNEERYQEIRFPDYSQTLFIQIGFIILNHKSFNLNKNEKTVCFNTLTELNKVRNKLYLTHGDDLGFFKQTQKEKRDDSILKNIKELFNLLALLQTGSTGYAVG